jgi:predicted HicB family RNase H-like nuclease
MATVTIRVDRETHATIRRLAQEQGVSMREMLRRIVT